MKKLSEVLPIINPNAKPLDKSSGTLNTQALGLTTEDGRMITQSTSQPNQQSLVNTSEQKLPLVLRDDTEGQTKLSRLLLISFDVLDTFGKEAEQLENINLAFQMYLEEYSYRSIEAAFKVYMKTNTVMPKPADIINIIAKPVVASVTDSLTDGQRLRIKELRELEKNYM